MNVLLKQERKLIKQLFIACKNDRNPEYFEKSTKILFDNIEKVSNPRVDLKFATDRPNDGYGGAFLILSPSEVKSPFINIDIRIDIYHIRVQFISVLTRNRDTHSCIYHFTDYLLTEEKLTENKVYNILQKCRFNLI